MESSLKNKFSLLLLFGVSVFFLAQCAQEKDENKKAAEVKTDTTSCTKKPVNPTGDSELALLMRDMLHSSESLKEMVKQGKLPEKFPEVFLKIHTAKPTDSATKHDSFDAFATNYIDNLQLLYKSPSKDLSKNYNAVINSCLSCHEEHCPGPIKTINKLKI